MKNSELKNYIKEYLKKHMNETMLNENLPLCCWDSSQNTTKSGCCLQNTGMCICHETETGGQFSEYCCDDEDEGGGKYLNPDDIDKVSKDRYIDPRDKERLQKRANIKK